MSQDVVARVHDRTRDQRCIVGKAPCGHYSFFVVIDEQFGASDCEEIGELLKLGWSMENKPVGWVRDGGLNFCKCAQREQHGNTYLGGAVNA